MKCWKWVEQNAGIQGEKSTFSFLFNVLHTKPNSISFDWRQFLSVIHSLHQCAFGLFIQFCPSTSISICIFCATSVFSMTQLILHKWILKTMWNKKWENATVDGYFKIAAGNIFRDGEPFCYEFTWTPKHLTSTKHFLGTIQLTWNWMSIDNEWPSFEIAQWIFAKQGGWKSFSCL